MDLGCLEESQVSTVLSNDHFPDVLQAVHLVTACTDSKTDQGRKGWRFSIVRYLESLKNRLMNLHSLEK